MLRMRVTTADSPTPGLSHAPTLDLVSRSRGSPHHFTALLSLLECSFLDSSTKTKFLLTEFRTPQFSTVNHSDTRYQHNDQRCLTFPKKIQFPKFTGQTNDILLVSLLICSPYIRLYGPTTVQPDVNVHDESSGLSLNLVLCKRPPTPICLPTIRCVYPLQNQQ